MIATYDSKTFTDLSVIIEMMPDEMKQKINPNFIKFVEDNKDEKYISNIDKTVPIRDQELNEEVKILLALIYRDYLCSKSEREELIKKEQEEIQKIEEEKRQKYNIEFKNNDIKSNDNVNKNTNEETSLTVYKKDSIFKKIFNKIRNLFKLN